MSYKLTIKIISMLSVAILAVFFIIAFSLTSNNNTQNLLTHQTNDTISEILGKEIFNEHVHLNRDEVKFYRPDGTYDDYANYDSQINYEKLSVTCSVHEHGRKILELDLSAEFGENNQPSFYSEELVALKMYFENDNFVRYWELENAFKMLYPNLSLKFKPKLCRNASFVSSKNHDLIYGFRKFVWIASYRTNLNISAGNRFVPDHIIHEICVDPTNPYDFFVKSTPYRQSYNAQT